MDVTWFWFFKELIDYSLELWAKLDLLLTKLLKSECFTAATRKEVSAHKPCNLPIYLGIGLQRIPATSLLKLQDRPLAHLVLSASYTQH